MVLSTSETERTVLNTTGTARKNYGSVPSKNATAPHRTGCCHRHGCYTREHSSNHFSTAHSPAQVADTSGSRSSCRCRRSSSCAHRLTAKRTADCCCKRARLIVNSRSHEPRCFQIPPTTAGPHAPDYSLGLSLPRSGDWTQIPVVRDRDPSHFLVPTSCANRCSPDGWATYCYSPTRVH